MIEPTELQELVYKWGNDYLGKEEMDPKTRAFRLLEEAIELCQCEGVTEIQVHRLAEHVFTKDTGNPLDESGDVAVCLMAYCGAKGIQFFRNAERTYDKCAAMGARKVKEKLAKKPRIL